MREAGMPRRSAATRACCHSRWLKGEANTCLHTAYFQVSIIPLRLLGGLRAGGKASLGGAFWGQVAQGGFLPLLSQARMRVQAVLLFEGVRVCC